MYNPGGDNAQSWFAGKSGDLKGGRRAVIFLRPVWTLLPSTDTDWRWQIGGDTIFWYPTMRLFRQTQTGNWGAVVTAMANALRINESGDFSDAGIR